VSSQPTVLRAFLGRDLAKAPSGALFVGAGDCFVASCAASLLSARRHIALNPYELISEPSLAKGRSVYLVSVSGRTASNIKAVGAVKGLAKETTAVTANAGGRLAAATDHAVLIPYNAPPRVPGTLSFSLSLLALIKLTRGRFSCDFAGVYSRAERNAGSFLFSESRVTHFLGNGASFPICLYSALKVSEILGAPAQWGMLDEYGHAPLFSLGKQDAVNVFCAFDPLKLGRKLSASLRGGGFEASAIPTFGSNPQEQVFHSVFLSQLAVLRKARSRGLSRPYFVLAPEKLAISDSMIY
jgi:fructoselysine-6-P-deglycase FrlB-like protein